MIRRRRLALAVAVALAAVLVAGACGVPKDERARPIATPLGVSTTSSPVTGGSSEHAVTLYFLGQGRLVKVKRRVETDTDSSVAIRTLLGGLTPAEKDKKELLSSIPPDTKLLGKPELKAGNQQLTINLSSELNGITGDSLKEAYAQIVWTAAEPTSVSLVRFLIEGKPIAVPTDKGNKDVVSRTDYQTLSPRENQ